MEESVQFETEVLPQSHCNSGGTWPKWDLFAAPLGSLLIFFFCNCVFHS